MISKTFSSVSISSRQFKLFISVIKVSRSNHEMTFRSCCFSLCKSFSVFHCSGNISVLFASWSAHRNLALIFSWESWHVRHRQRPRDWYHWRWKLMLISCLSCRFHAIMYSTHPTRLECALCQSNRQRLSPSDVNLPSSPCIVCCYFWSCYR